MDDRNFEPEGSTKEVVTSTTQPQPHYSDLQVASDPKPAWANYVYGASRSSDRTFCGLRRSTFILTVALVVVIIAAAVGGGVGGSLAVRNARSECNTSGKAAAATATVTKTVSVASASSSGGLVVPTAVLALDCPDLDSQGQQIVTLGSKSWRFTPSCGTDYNGNDIGGVVVYSFSDCLMACASHNYWVGEDECKAVHFNADMESSIAKYYGDCWLKNGTDTIIRDLGNLEVTAKLVSSG